MINSFLAGIGLGAVLAAAVCIWRVHSAANNRKRIPRQWPFVARPLVNSQQQRVWTWLAKVMFDHQVLVKIPVTRFTAPAGDSDANHWYELLNGVYCNFTVCNAQGRVVGCVDIQGANTPSMSNQMLKQSLLSQCGIHYWVVDPNNLPPLIALRTAFFGEHAAKDSTVDALDSRFNDGRESLQAAVHRLRHNKTSKTVPVPAPQLDDAKFSASQVGAGWDQNSFVTPLDSRTMDLSK
jgi:hypothetical protein